jgi:hypothetical protein
MAKRLTTAGLAALVFATSAIAAHAETAKPKIAPRASFTAREDFAPDLNEWGPQRTHRSMQWDAKKGRWGVKLDLDQTQVRDMNWSETGAGAYYKLTPGLRVGGGVSVNSVGDGRGLVPQDRPRVKLETAFKF